MRLLVLERPIPCSEFFTGVFRLAVTSFSFSLDIPAPLSKNIGVQLGAVFGWADFQDNAPVFLHIPQPV